MLASGGHGPRWLFGALVLSSVLCYTWYSAVPIGWKEMAAPAAEKYVIQSRSCRIPDFDPFDVTVRKFSWKEPPLSCPKHPTYTYVTGLPGEDRVLVVNGSFSCCYSDVRRVTVARRPVDKMADSHYELSPKTCFEGNITLDPSSEFVVVNCALGLFRKHTEMHIVTPLKPAVRDKIRRKETNNDSNSDQLSVMLLGIDNMSRLNIKRSMPNTVQFLNKNGWVELTAYNKVGSNTFPNLMAILSGLDVNKKGGRCWPGANETVLDECPMIWKEFANRGYVTGLAEDLLEYGTFNYLQIGFVEQPTDYYFRPFLLAAEKLMPRKSRESMTVCLGAKPLTNYMLDFLGGVVETFKSTNLFTLTWLNNFSHNEINGPSLADDTLHEFFEKMTRLGITNASMIAFFSDHGARVGKIRTTQIGWYEERLPFVYVWLPPWFREKYPLAYENLKANTGALTSPFDLHWTLRDVLNLPETGSRMHLDSGPKNSSFCPKCASLFARIPADRSCEDAGISKEWCTCGQCDAVSTDDADILESAEFLVSEVDFILRNHIVSGNCARLSLQNVKNACKSVSNVSSGVFVDYVISVETVPGGGLFEGTVRTSNFRQKRKLIGFISRLNMYGNQSHCVQDSFLRLYCYCSDNLPP